MKEYKMAKGKKVSDLLSKIKRAIYRPYTKQPEKNNMSAAVKHMRALTARIKPKLLWASKPDINLKGNTYVKTRHGELS